MTFMDETIDKSISIWDDCANEKFLNEMADGTLDKKKFYDYIIQDSIYLRGYLKEFAFAMTKALPRRRPFPHCAHGWKVLRSQSCSTAPILPPSSSRTS